MENGVKKASLGGIAGACGAVREDDEGGMEVGSTEGAAMVAVVMVAVDVTSGAEVRVLSVQQNGRSNSSVTDRL